MTSRGIGDVRRVLGEEKSWIAQHFDRPAPPLPDRNGDPLLDFVCLRLLERENQVVTEAREYHDIDVPGAVVHRYALDVRRQCAALRRVLVRYAEARDSNHPDLPWLREIIQDLSFAWSNDPRWRERWD